MDSIDELIRKEKEIKKAREKAQKEKTQIPIECSSCAGIAVMREDWGDEVRFACEDCSVPGVGLRLEETGRGSNES